MDAQTVPKTIDEAELAGWHGLQITHACCRHGTTVLPWARLRSRQRYRRLDEIVARLVCEHCRTPPVAVGLWSIAPESAGGEMKSLAIAGGKDGPPGRIAGGLPKRRAAGRGL